MSEAKELAGPALARKSGAVILAAGSSSRMGRPKLLLPWGATSVLGHQIQTWRSLSVGQIAAVVAAGDTTVQAELDRLGFSTRDRISPAALFVNVTARISWGLA